MAIVQCNLPVANLTAVSLSRDVGISEPSAHARAFRILRELHGYRADRFLRSRLDHLLARRYSSDCCRARFTALRYR